MYRILRQRGKNMSILPFMAECVSFRGNRRQKGANDEYLVADRATRGLRKLYKLAGARRVFRRAPLRISRPVSRVLCGERDEVLA